MKQTPESKLLDLIKNKPSWTSWLKLRKEWFSLKISKAISFLSPQKRSSSFDKRTRISSFQALNRVMVILIFVLMGMTVRKLFVSKPAQEIFWEEEWRSENLSSEEKINSKGRQGVSLKMVSKRNLFRPLIVPKPIKKAPQVRRVVKPPPAPKIPIRKRAAHLTLVGVITGDSLQAIIEDRKRRTTLYVSEGESIGELTVTKVMPDRVVLSFEEETWDLRL